MKAARNHIRLVDAAIAEIADQPTNFVGVVLQNEMGGVDEGLEC
jgi:hypothetical protein